MQEFALFIIGDRCDEINKWIELISKEKIIIIDEDKCFDVAVGLDTGCIILFFSAGFYIIIGTLILRKC